MSGAQSSKFQRSSSKEAPHPSPKPARAAGYPKWAGFEIRQPASKAEREQRHEFDWGEFTLKESLAAFASQFAGKAQKPRNWHGSFSEKWLVMSLGKGCPLACLGKEPAAADPDATAAPAVSSSPRRPNPFAGVILFAGPAQLAFPAPDANLHTLSTLSAEVLARGAAPADQPLDWKSNLTSTVVHS